MGLVIVIAVFPLSCALLFVTFRRLRRCRATPAWWLCFGVLAVVGAGLGYWLAFHVDYQTSPTIRFISFPIPLSFLHLEDGQWVDFPTPEFVMYPGLATNMLAVTT